LPFFHHSILQMTYYLSALARCGAQPWLALLLGLPLTTLAQPSLTDISPTRNQRNVPRTTDVALTFNHAISAATAGNVRVFSAQRGGQRVRSGQGTVSGGGTNTITFNPATDFQPGETVFVTVPPTVFSTSGAAAARHAYQFTAAAGGTGTGSFSGTTAVGVGTNPSALATGDVDGDGDLDLLVANEGANTVSVRFNNGSGSFSGGSTVSVGANPQGVVLGDVDNDGDLDFLAANYGSNTVSVRFNNGSGTFSGSQNVAVAGTPKAVVLGDVDADGDLDLLTANYALNSVSIVSNDGSGTFSGTQNVPSAAVAPYSLATGDMDGDGDLDLVTTGYGNNAVNVRLNNNGVFNGVPGFVPGTGANPASVALGDLDGDGDLDLVTANYNSSNVTVRLNSGGAALTGGTPTQTVDFRPASVALGDVDADGDLDLVTANSGASTVSLRLNDGTGTFSTFGGTNSFGVGQSPRAVALADVDGDGDLDVLTANYDDNSVSVRFNYPKTTLTSLSPDMGLPGAVVNLNGTNFTGATIVSFNGVAASFTVNSPTSITATVPANAATGLVTVTTPQGNTSNGIIFGVMPTLAFLSPRTGPVGTTVTLVGNSLLDITEIRFNNTPATYFASNSPNSIFVGVPAGATTGPVTVTTLDGTSNALPFRVGTPLGVTSFSPARNANNVPVGANVTTTFAQPLQATAATRQALRVFSQQRGGQLADAQGGVATVSGNTLTFNPTTNFKPGETLTVTTTPAATATSGDLLASGPVRQFTTATGGTGRGFFAQPTTGAEASVGTTPRGVTAGDMDGDGDLDLLTANEGANTVSIRANNGAGGFAGTTDVNVGASPRGLAVGDMDNDGDLDLVTANPAANSVSVCLNAGNGTFGAPLIVSVGTSPQDVVLGDINGDGILDLLTADSGSTTVSVRLNIGGARFVATDNVNLGGSPNSLTLGDVNNDNSLDIVTVNRGGYLNVFVNAGGGFFSTAPGGVLGGDPLRAVLGDLDGDGDLDLVTANSSANTISIRTNDGTGFFYFGSDQDLVVGTNVSSVALGDVDADGDLDLVATNVDASTATNWRNDGLGSFGDAQTVALGLTPNSVALADVDADGDLDLLAANGGGGTVSVRLNQPPPPPVLTALNPTTGPAGSVVTLTGTNFTWATGVSFNGTAATTFTVSSATTITATVPMGATTGNVIVMSPGGLSNGVLFTVTALAPDLIVSSAQSVAGGTYNTVTVTGIGVLTLTAPLVVNSAFNVQAGGDLNTNCQPITGAGSFTLAAGATLAICSPQGISASGASGAVQVTGGRSFSVAATYRYTGSGDQQTGTGLPATVRELEIANPAGVLLSQSTAVTHVLRLTSGTLATGERTLTLRSTAAHQAIAIHAGGTTSGAVTVERYVPLPAASYHHLSSPVASAPVSDLTTPGFTPKVNPAYNVLPTPALTASQFPSVFGYDETRGGATATTFTDGYYSPAALSTVLAPGRGYTVYMPGNKTPDFVGALTTGPLNVALSVTGDPATSGKAGWHLLGNPYPQPIDWDLLTTPPNLEASVYVWYSTGGANGVYRTRNASGVGNLTDGLIGVGQGFWVRATAPTTFSFTNALRVEANVGLSRSAAKPSLLTLTLTDAAGQQDAATVYVEPGATAGFDGAFDAVRPGRNVGAPTLSALIAGHEAMISALPETALTQPTTVELTAVLPTPGTYALEVDALTTWGAGTSVELLDRLTNTRYDLTQQPSVTIRATRANEEVTGRFALLLNHGRVLGTAATLAAGPLTVYPNPVAGTASVSVTGAAAMGRTATILDATGRTVRTATIEDDGSLSVRGLAAGVYAVRVGTATALLVIE
jgi:FG-GAP-like repeat/Bacterial Ig-like domain/Secretion system C-terminal sorting domain/FG-GAP repeat